MESYRRPGGARSPSKHEVHHLGTLPRGDELEAQVCDGKYQVAMLKAEWQGVQAPMLLPPAEVAKAIIARRQRTPDPTQHTTVAVEDLIEEGRVTVGVHEVFGPLFSRFGLEELFPPRATHLQLGVPGRWCYSAWRPLGQSKCVQVKLAK